ncbi:MAG TPA: TetR family transcriptional regulator [Solirubrobacteraceae bacterium]
MSVPAAREQLSGVQRARIVSATIDVVAEQGVVNASVAHIVARSSVSRRTFYEIFADRDDCFLAAFDDAIALASRRVGEAYDPKAKWAANIRASLIALLRFLEDEPLIARLMIVESLSMGPKVLHHRSQALTRTMTFLDGGRHETDSQDGPPPLTAEGVVGAVLSILYARLSQASTGQLMELTNQLTSTMVLPYLGVAASRRELTRPVPEHKSNPSTPLGTSDPLRELGMRITYRTILVLNAIANSPGSSNRTIGELAGIADQGQVSKLLRRLAGYGLIQTTGDAATRGEPNAWTLTPHGRSIVQMVG